jgi:hypothetical protein
MYRNQEDILEAIKPLLADSCVLTLNDEIILIGDRYYVKATAKLSNGKEEVSAVAYAREPLTRKGMDDAQVTGATSSYARKYALNGLFCIDDTKDADSNEAKAQEAKETVEKPKEEKPARPPEVMMEGKEFLALQDEIKNSITMGDLQATWGKVKLKIGEMSKAQLNALTKEKDKTKTIILEENGGVGI